MNIPYEMLPFIGHSHLVALVRNGKKGVVNNAYTNYIQKVFFEPLMIKLKTLCPSAYQQINPFSPFRHTLLFPEHKRYCLFVCISIDGAKKKRLSFFVYQQEHNLIYEWTYFPESTYRKYKLAPFDLPKIFNPICKVDTWQCLSNLECTLDDDDFWSNYVFKKEDNEYVYLKEIKFD